MGQFMNIPFHYHAENDPATKRRDRREFQTAQDADEYSAQLQIDQARNTKQVPSLDTFQGKSLGTLGDGSAPPQPNSDVYGMTKPGGVLGETKAGQNAYKSEVERLQSEKDNEQTKVVGQFLQQYADKYGLNDEARADLIRGLVNVGLSKAGLEQALKYADELEARKIDQTNHQQDMNKLDDKQAFEDSQRIADEQARLKETKLKLGNLGTLRK